MLATELAPVSCMPCLFPAVVQCEVLEFPDNGQVIQIGNRVGATATYSCFPGYLLEGEELRICQKSAEWTGTPPTCRRK